MRQSTNDHSGCQGFTLIELMAVLTILVILAGVVLGFTTYAHQKSLTYRARAEIAALETALEQYRADFGYYPPTPAVRISRQGSAELSNSFILAKALLGATGVVNNVVQFSGAHQYLKLPPQTLKGFSAVYWDGSTFTNVLTLPAIIDPFGKPYNYYCNPAAPYFVNNSTHITGSQTMFPGADGSVSGGQVNGSSYDLWSYGPDLATAYPTTNPSTNLQAWTLYQLYGAAGWEGWQKANPGGDDITNFGQ
jgi:prepilin-type N-terminal cleavage/methylation domain-containing protein